MIENVKKYILLWIVGLFLTIWIWVYIFERNSSSKEFLDYIPSNFDQVFYVDFDQDLKNLVTELPNDKMPDDFKNVLFKINRAAVYQYLTWEKIISFMIVNVKDDFDVKAAIKAWLMNTGADYKYENIADNTYIYWNDLALSFFKKWWYSNLSENQDIKDYVSSIKDWKYNVFLSSNTNSLGWTWSTFSEYLKYLKYTVIASHVGKDDTYWLVDVLFTKDLEFAKTYSFEDTLSKFWNTNDLFFVQMWNLMQLIWSSKETISTTLMAWVQQTFPDYNNILLQDDYNKLVDSFDGNISINVWEADNLLWLWVNVVFEKSWLYDVLYKFYPYIKEMVSKDVYSGSVSTFEETNKFWFNVVLPYLTWKIDWKVYLEKKWDNAVLSIFQPKEYTDGWLIKFDSSKNTVLEFYVNAWKVINTLNKFSLLLGQWSDLTKNMEMLSDKKFHWTVNIYPRKLNLIIKTSK